VKVLGPRELERAREGVSQPIEPGLGARSVLEHRDGDRESGHGKPRDGDHEQQELTQRQREGKRDEQSEDEENRKPRGNLGPRFPEPVPGDESRGRRVGAGEDEREDEDVHELGRRRGHEQRAAGEGPEPERRPDPVAVEANGLG
jgi:hypothetical protein